MIRLTFFLLISIPLNAQTDSVRYDKWIGWITPTSVFNGDHPAVEIGAEFNPENRLAYTLSYGLDVRKREERLRNNSENHYIRLGVKKYLGKKTTSSYLMGELGLFRLSQDASNYWGTPTSDEVYYAKTRLNYFFLKPGLIFGGKVSIGELRFDFFTGIGYRLGLRNHKVTELTDFLVQSPIDFPDYYYTKNGQFISSEKGWNSIKGKPFFSLGARFGIGFKTIKKYADN